VTPDPLWPRASDWLARGDHHPALQVLGLPTSSASISPSEAWRTPGALRDVLARFSTFDGERGIDLADLAVRDLGDLDIAELAPAEAVAAITAAVAALPADPVTVLLGGDNVVTAPVVAAHPAAPLARMGVVTFDAHHDVRTYTDTPSNGAPIRWLLDQGLPGDQVVQVGIHSHANSRAYREFCDQQGVRTVTVDEVERRGDLLKAHLHAIPRGASEARLADPQAVLAPTVSPEERVHVGHAWRRLAVALLAMGAADYLWQRHRHRRDLRMTREEVKREMRDSEGDPRHKAERQRLHRALLEQRMLAEVRKADFVVVNPDHIAVALRYDRDSQGAPVVVAKGERLLAQKIKDVAREARVPIFHDVTLARSLRDVVEGDEIPEALYEAVAEILRVVQGMAGDAGGAVAAPAEPPGPAASSPAGTHWRRV
jgi:type III secretion system FlhB-like substrate exporter